MNVRKTIFTAAIMAVSLAACDNDAGELPLDADGKPIAASFSTGINEAVPTRAAGTEWALNDKIGISATGNDAMAEMYKNVLFTTTAAGTESKLNSTTTIYFQDMNSVTFTAYYPFYGTEGTAAGKISGETTAQYQTTENQPTIDYLYASVKTSYANPNVSLNFEHKMSQIEITFKAGNGVSSDEIAAIDGYTISGLRLYGSFDTATGTAAADETKDAEALTIEKGSSAQQTSLIVYPQSTTSFTLSLSMGGSTYACNLAAASGFTAGKSYKYEVTVNKTDLSVSSATISGWTSATEVTGTAELDPTLYLDKYESADEITDDVIASSIVDGKLVVTGAYDQAKLAKISAYVRAGTSKSPAVTTLDLSGLTGGPTEFVYWGDNQTYFGGSNSLVTAILPTSVTDLIITFRYCTALTTVLGLDNVTYALMPFDGCSSLKTAPDMPSLTELYATFSESGITEYVNDKITEIGSSSFESCTALTKVDCPNVTNLKDAVFRGCSNLTEIRLTTAENLSFMYVSDDDYGTFTYFDNIGNCTLYLNENQKENISSEGKWTNGILEGDCDLSGFKAIYCGDEQVWPL